MKTIAQYKSFNYCGKIPLQQKYLLYYGSLRNEYLSHFILKGEFYLAWRRIICHGCKVESKYFEGRCDTCFSTFKSGQQTQVFLTLTLKGLNPHMKQCCLTPEAFLFDFFLQMKIFLRYTQFIFVCSVETQHTIGYGGRQTTEECPEAIIIMCVQENVTKSPLLNLSIHMKYTRT